MSLGRIAPKDEGAGEGTGGGGGWGERERENGLLKRRLARDYHENEDPLSAVSKYDRSPSPAREPAIQGRDRAPTRAFGEREPPSCARKIVSRKNRTDPSGKLNSLDHRSRAPQPHR